MQTKVIQLGATNKELVYTATVLTEVELTLRDNGIVNFFTDENGGALSLDTDVPRLVRLSAGDRLYLRTDSIAPQLVEILIQEPANEPTFEDYAEKSLAMHSHTASILEFIAKRLESGILYIINTTLKKDGK